MDTQVLIAGAGPTGLTLALDLGRRGVRCTIIEQKDAPQFLPKMERCNARTMEIYRRIGIADRIRAAGLPGHCPMDVFIVLSLVEPPLLHLPYPSVARGEGADRRHQRRQRAARALSADLAIHARAAAEIDRRGAAVGRRCATAASCCRSRRIADVGHRHGQRAAARPPRSQAQYLVGCDGGASLVRRQLGIGLQGDSNLLQLRQALYHCEDLYERIPIGKGRHYHVADAQSTFLIVQDSTRHFTLHSVVESDADMATMFERTVAMPVEYDMLYVGQWRQNLLLADSYGQGRVFLAGDAVHLVIPTGGLGMNSGVGDAIDLSWKLAAVLQAGAAPICCRPTRSSGGRSASAMSRRRATPRSGGGPGGRPIGRTSATTRRRAPRPAPIFRASPTSSSARATR